MKERNPATLNHIVLIDKIMANGGKYADAMRATGLDRWVVYRAHNRQASYANVPIDHDGERLPGGTYGTRRKVPLEVVPTIDKLRKEGHTLKAIAEIFNCEFQTIARASKRQGTYKNVPK